MQGCNHTSFPITMLPERMCRVLRHTAVPVLCIPSITRRRYRMVREQLAACLDSAEQLRATAGHAAAQQHRRTDLLNSQLMDLTISSPTTDSGRLELGGADQFTHVPCATPKNYTYWSVILSEEICAMAWITLPGLPRPGSRRSLMHRSLLRAVCPCSAPAS